MQQLIRKNTKFIIITFLLVLLTAVTSMIAPFLLQLFSSQKEALNPRLLLYVAVAMLVSFLAKLAMMIYRENYAAKFNVDYLFQLLAKVTKLNYDQYQELESSYLMNRIFTAVDSLYLFLTNSFAGLISALFTIITSLILVSLISWPMGLLFFSLLPLNYFGFRAINRQLKQKMATMQKQSASTNKDLLNTFANIDYLKAQDNQHILANYLEPRVTNMYEILAETNKFALGTSSLIEFINQAAQNITLIWSSLLIVQKQFSLGNLMVLSLVIPLYYAALTQLSQINLDYKTLETSNDFIHNELDEYQEASGDTELDHIEEITLNQPTFTIKDQTYEFQLTAQLLPGDVVYLAGASGQGKSSLLKLLLKFRPATGILINQQASNRLATHSLREKIGYLPQEATILTASLAENISMGGPLSEQAKVKLVQSGILSPILATKSWSTPILENGANLSGGEKQRIALARLLLKDPDVFILDESFSNIDGAATAEIMTYLLNNAATKIVIYTSHDPGAKVYANKILTLPSKGS